MSTLGPSTTTILHWREAVEALVLLAGLYGLWAVGRVARAGRALLGLIVVMVASTLAAELLQLQIVGWLLRNLTTFLAFALVVVFQPELRRAIIALGTHRLLSFGGQSQESVAVLAEAAFELANRQFGALIAVERDGSLERFAESGLAIDSALSVELLVTIFHPKTPLHDGGVIVRGDRIVAAAAIFPVSQRMDLERNLGLRHRAGLGLTEENVAVIIVVSEESGIISICHGGVIERNFDPDGFKKRLAELLHARDGEEAAAAKARGDKAARGRPALTGTAAAESRDDRLAF